MEAIGKITVTAILIVFGVIWGGWVLCILWGWFVVPIFGLPQLTIVHGIGLRLVASYLTPQFSREEKHDKVFWKHLVYSVCLKMFWGLLTLGLGLIYKQFM